MDPQPTSDGERQNANLDDQEVARFERMAKEWWDATGKFRPLHQIGPARLEFIRDSLKAHFGLDQNPRLKPLTGLTVLDIGCGGGLISEPLARMGATVTGIDPGALNIAVAKDHCANQDLAINYRVATVEDLVQTDVKFDAVVCLEVVEHVPDVGAFVAGCASLIKPGGAMVLSTLNRTIKSYALAIVGAEYVLQWLPKGTHQWERFVTPDELARALSAAGLEPGAATGLVYSVLTGRWSLDAADTDVNYLMSAAKPEHVAT